MGIAGAMCHELMLWCSGSGWYNRRWVTMWAEDAVHSSGSREDPASPVLLPSGFGEEWAVVGTALGTESDQAPWDLGTRSTCLPIHPRGWSQAEIGLVGPPSQQQTLVTVLYFIEEIVGLGTIFLIKSSSWDSSFPHRGEFSLGLLWDFLHLFLS